MPRGGAEDSGAVRASQRSIARSKKASLGLIVAFRSRGKGKKCWDVASNGYNMSSQYPGNQEIIEKICGKKFPNKNVEANVIFPKDNECKLRCLHKERKGRYTRTHWLDVDTPDFTRCGRKKACIKGRCVRTWRLGPDGE
ncbi:uncharacterized protein LOC144105090 [Amblyomma americanum]